VLEAATMRIEITDQAVLLTDLNDEDRDMIREILRRTAGTSLVIPRKATVASILTEEQELEALIASLRTSAQDTLAALRHRGFRIASR
jgi:hypothetical protein